MDARGDLLRRAAALNVHRSGGRRAPHKPLLVLLAVARLQAEGAVEARWDWWSTKLGPLLVEYAPSSAAPSPEYPFRRLVGDGLWQIHGLADYGDEAFVAGEQRVRDFRRRFLNDHDPAAGLPPEFESLLRTSPDTVDQLVRLLLHRHFPPTLWEDVLRDTGVQHDLTRMVTLPAGVLDDIAVDGRRRSGRFAAEVLQLDDGRCQLCDFDGREVVQGVPTPVGLDAAHVRWWNADGEDDPQNGLTLCALHHRLFDRGMLGFDPESRLAVVSPRLRVTTRWAVVAGDVTAPARIDERNLTWQHRNVYKAA